MRQRQKKEERYERFEEKNSTNLPSVPGAAAAPGDRPRARAPTTEDTSKWEPAEQVGKTGEKKKKKKRKQRAKGEKKTDLSSCHFRLLIILFVFFGGFLLVFFPFSLFSLSVVARTSARGSSCSRARWVPRSVSWPRRRASRTFLALPSRAMRRTRNNTNLADNG